MRLRGNWLAEYKRYAYGDDARCRSAGDPFQMLRWWTRTAALTAARDHLKRTVTLTGAIRGYVGSWLISVGSGLTGIGGRLALGSVSDRFVRGYGFSVKEAYVFVCLI